MDGSRWGLSRRVLEIALEGATAEVTPPTGAPPASAAATPPAATPPIAGADAGAPPNAEAPADRDEHGRFRNPVQPRIDALTKEREDARREAAYWRARADAAAAPPPPAPEKKPVAEDFDTYDEYVEALTDFKAKAIVDERLTDRDKKAEERTAETARATTWGSRLDAAKTAIPDMDATLRASSTPIMPHVGDVLMEADRGPELLLHLAKHPDVAEKLNAMKPMAAARELGRIEGSLPALQSVPPADDTPPPDKDKPTDTPPASAARTTTAPPPVKTTGSGRSTTTKLADLPMDQYIEERKKQGAKWARR